ncbi:hypothetical protein CNMCM5793_005696 [Aspergillus hiratsukae]|uniref:NACHT domain-containing protein n=1 Tax=Aspergillus hiratsukae TaxID=1194566 RepID=A0A8H6UWU6_9EURO|nr:hypothetical protein CNMCM5793_005696 [Aspergillus hiratsukae]KAF7169797.1 hypothetical protein CNMCM6106_004716 [Aspergillus hiratsukae]
MAARKSLKSPDLYTVGWIAALPIELAAATAMLDEEHEKPWNFIQSHQDTNIYTWGRIGEHNVVITSLAAGVYGTISAATTASSMLASFPHIRIGLLVGIGAGVARPEEGRDIRLGDIAVSQPQGSNGGVIQYDLYKVKPGNQRESRAFLNRPPEVLLKALARLQAEHERKPSRVPEFLAQMGRDNPKMVKQRAGYVHQGVEHDRLFKATEPYEEIKREPRESTEPEIHYGTIASGNTLFKDAIHRDKILEDIRQECICFEMEAAGLMNTFPCIVIRGICDYADVHKSDRWQRYAAATAAAYTKELLSYIPTQDLQRTQKALDILKDIAGSVANIHSISTSTAAAVEGLSEDRQHMKVKKWLSSPDPSNNLNEALERHHEGTGSWFLESDPFQEWKSGTRRHLWLHGIPGCGKTVLSATIIKHLNQQLEASHVVLYFFFDFSNRDKQSLDKLVRSLAAQLYARCDTSRKDLNETFSLCEGGSQQPTFKLLCTTLLQMLNYVERVYIVIDALDECTTRLDLLLWLESVASSGPAGVQLILTSRKEEEIESQLQRWLCPQSHIPIQQDSVNHDIRAYIHERLQCDREFERWRSQPSVQDEIESELMKKADGMFRWASCQLDILQNCLDLRMLRESLASLPMTLQETYAGILASIDSHHRQYAIKILQFLTYSDRRLTIQEAVDVIVVDPSGQPFFDPRLRMPNPRDIMKVCSSLVSLVTNRDSSHPAGMELQLAHLSVREYLSSKVIREAFPKEMAEIGEIFQTSINEISARADITRVCIAYLECLGNKRSFHELMADFPLDWERSRSVGSAFEELKAEFPLAEYSAKYWMDHARTVETERDISERILHFFNHQSQVYAVWRGLFGEDRWISRKIPTPLYFASLSGLQHTVRLLLEEGADVNAEGGRFHCPLMAACSQGHKAIVRLLLDKGATFKVQGDLYDNHLVRACSFGHAEVVQLLIERCADINTPVSGLSVAPNALQVASCRGDEHIVQLLLDSGVDVNAPIVGSPYHSVLEAASSQGSKEIVQLLLNKGANPNGPGVHDKTPLLAASRKGHREIVELLLDHGADIDFPGKHYDTPLRLACINRHKDIVQLLLGRGANIYTPCTGFFAENALQAACRQGNTDIVRLLLENGAIHSRPRDYGSALQTAAGWGHMGTVQLLLEKVTDIKFLGGDYAGALEAATNRGHIEIVQLLSERGGNVSVPEHSSPLNEALSRSDNII